MAPKVIDTLAKQTNSYVKYMELMENLKENSDAVYGVQVRRKRKEGTTVYYDLCVGEVMCRLPKYRLNEDDEWEETTEPCMKVFDTTNAVRKHINHTSEHKHDKCGVKDGGSGGGVDWIEYQEAATFFRAAYALHKHGEKEQTEKTRMMYHGETVPGDFSLPYDNKTKEAVKNEEERFDGPTDGNVVSSPASRAANPPTPRRGTAKAKKPDLWEIPRYQAGANKGKVNYTQVKNDLKKDNRQYPCDNCKTKAVGVRKGNKKKSTRCNIADPECANYVHYEHVAGEEAAAPAPRKTPSGKGKQPAIAKPAAKKRKVVTSASPFEVDSGASGDDGSRDDGSGDDGASDI